MKIRTELSDQEEIVIRCREKTDRINHLELAIRQVLTGEDTITLSSGGAEFFVPKSKILYFESASGTIYAHTTTNIYTAHYKLCELEGMMAPGFTRVSKSAVANLMQVCSIQREVVGNGVLTFYGCDKRVWFSRAYFKLLQYKLDELRN